ncbi:hypothetical protein ES703_44295 [subsurface metagenome]
MLYPGVDFVGTKTSIKVESLPQRDIDASEATAYGCCQRCLKSNLISLYGIQSALGKSGAKRVLGLIAYDGSVPLKLDSCGF